MRSYPHTTGRTLHTAIAGEARTAKPKLSVPSMYYYTACLSHLTVHKTETKDKRQIEKLAPMPRVQYQLLRDIIISSLVGVYNMKRLKNRKIVSPPCSQRGHGGERCLAKGDIVGDMLLSRSHCWEGKSCTSSIFFLLAWCWTSTLRPSPQATKNMSGGTPLQ